MLRNWMYRIIIASLFLALTLGGSVALAQGGSTAIEYGQTVTGEITNKAFEIMYTFKGDALDIVLVNMSSLGEKGGLEQPGIMLLNPAGEVIASVGEDYAYKTMLLSAQLPTKGDYTIVATRSYGRAGKSIGKFSLNLLKLEKLVLGVPAKGTVTRVGDAKPTENLYAIEAKGPFRVQYQSQSDTVAYVTVKIVKNSGIDDIAQLRGYVSDGEIGIAAKSGTLYIVAVSGDLPEKSKAEYTVTLAGKK